MWRYEPFINMLARLIDLEMCGEIIIINNALEHTPTDPVLAHSKIRMLCYGHNIGVNPAWNAGVTAATYSNICIMNDDVVYDTRVFDRVAAVLKSGVFVVNSVWPFDNPTSNPGTIDILPYQHSDQLFHYGSLMFITREDWIPIPEQLILFFGDNWIWYHMWVRYQSIYVIWNLNLSTPGSVTCNSFSNKHEILEHEHIIYGEQITELNKFLNQKSS
jgi:hypothetical protein